MARIERFCVVGLGAHARTKLIPALIANGQTLAGVVTNQPKIDVGGATVFRSLGAALRSTPSDVAFIVATPPAAHYRQTRAIVEAGRDVIVEKPAFTAARDATAIAGLSPSGSTVIAEGFMHRFTGLCARLLTLWAARRGDVTQLKIAFTIPEAPAGTFRRENRIASSILFDIGSYPLSLLIDMGLNCDPLRLAALANAGVVDRENARLGGVLNGVEVSVEIGVAARYANVVTVGLEQGESWRFEPFFYGRHADRSITRSLDGAVMTETLDDPNAFESMLRLPREDWLADQPARLARMVEVAAALERLGRAAARRRRDSRGQRGIGAATTSP